MRPMISTIFAIALALGSSMPTAHAAPAGIPKRLYLASHGRANAADGDGALQWGPWEREPSDKFTFDPKQPPDTAGKLVYATAPLERPVQISGPISLELYASDVGTQFTGVIEDVQPDGQVVPVSSSPLAAAAGPSSARAGKVEPIRIDLGAVEHVFLPEHRIRLEITSHATSTSGTDTDANPRLMHSIAYPSALVLRVTD